jgi:hypothetical protein
LNDEFISFLPLCLVPQRGPAASVATFDMLAVPRGPGAPPNSRPPPPTNNGTGAGGPQLQPQPQSQPDRHLAEFYGTHNGQPPPGANGNGMQHSNSGQFRGSVTLGGAPPPGTAAGGPSPLKKQPSSASVLGMLKSKLSGL